MSGLTDIHRALEAQYDEGYLTFASSLEAHYDQVDGLDDLLAVTFDETCERLGLSHRLEQCITADLGKILYVILSAVGDDEYSTSNSRSWGPAIIGFGPVINGIKLSWKDAGDSPYVGNYAEGWVITPPSSEATFEATNRRHARSGVPFILDPVKLKLLSPVRKQSQNWELDLESKLEHLAEIAAWTDRNWFSYDYHQLSLILANAVFDFEDARTFPYLFKTEGGCGGQPPYGNLATVYSALHFYTRGRSRRGIIGVMEEAVGVNTGAISPKDTYFLRNSHLANMGDSTWLKYESAYRSLVEQNGLSRLEAEDLLKSQEAVGLPDHIRNYGVEVDASTYAVGASISALRKEGLIMSEIDVKAALDAQVRNEAILGDEPIGILNERLKSEYSKFKSTHLKILSQISELDPTVRRDLQDRGLMMPTEPSTELWEVLTSYYSMRTEQYSRYSSLFYTDTIRIFKTSDIRMVLEGHSHGVREDFAATVSFPRKWTVPFLEETTDEREKRGVAHAWIESAPLAQLLKQPLPPGIGTDDDRIARNIIGLDQEIPAEENVGMILVILFSGDRQLARLTSQIMRSNSKRAFRMLCFDRSAYVRICLEGLQQRNLLISRGVNCEGHRPWSTDKVNRDVVYYNYILKRNWIFPQSVIDQIEDIGRISSATGRWLCHVEYDYPNMERGLDALRLDPRTGTVEEYGGGYLEARTLRAFAPTMCWAKEELRTIYSWPDFDIVRCRRHYPWRGRVKHERIVGHDPTSRRTYSFVGSWRKKTSSEITRPHFGGRDSQRSLSISEKPLTGA